MCKSPRRFIDVTNICHDLRGQLLDRTTVQGLGVLPVVTTTCSVSLVP